MVILAERVKAIQYEFYPWAKEFATFTMFYVNIAYVCTFVFFLFLYSCDVFRYSVYDIVGRLYE